MSTPRLSIDFVSNHATSKIHFAFCLNTVRDYSHAEGSVRLYSCSCAGRSGRVFFSTHSRFHFALVQCQVVSSLLPKKKKRSRPLTDHVLLARQGVCVSLTFSQFQERSQWKTTRLTYSLTLRLIDSLISSSFSSILTHERNARTRTRTRAHAHVDDRSGLLPHLQCQGLLNVFALS